MEKQLRELDELIADFKKWTALYPTTRYRETLVKLQAQRATMANTIGRRKK